MTYPLDPISLFILRITIHSEHGLSSKQDPRTQATNGRPSLCQKLLGIPIIYHVSTVGDLPTINIYYWNHHAPLEYQWNHQTPTLDPVRHKTGRALAGCPTTGATPRSPWQRSLRWRDFLRRRTQSVHRHRLQRRTKDQKVPWFHRLDRETGGLNKGGKWKSMMGIDIGLKAWVLHVEFVWRLIFVNRGFFIWTKSSQHARMYISFL